MAENQAREVFTQIASILREVGLSWVVEQVQATIAEGTVTDCRVRISTQNRRHSASDTFILESITDRGEQRSLGSPASSAVEPLWIDVTVEPAAGQRVSGGTFQAFTAFTPEEELQLLLDALTAVADLAEADSETPRILGLPTQLESDRTTEALQRQAAGDASEIRRLVRDLKDNLAKSGEPA